MSYENTENVLATSSVTCEWLNTWLRYSPSVDRCWWHHEGRATCGQRWGVENSCRSNWGSRYTACNDRHWRLSANSTHKQHLDLYQQTAKPRHQYRVTDVQTCRQNESFCPHATWVSKTAHEYHSK